MFYFDNDLRKRERNIRFMIFYILDYYFPPKKMRRLVVLVIGTWKIPPRKIVPYPNQTLTFTQREFVEGQFNLVNYIFQPCHLPILLVSNIICYS